MNKVLGRGDGKVMRNLVNFLNSIIFKSSALVFFFFYFLWENKEKLFFRIFDKMV